MAVHTAFAASVRVVLPKRPKVVHVDARPRLVRYSVRAARPSSPPSAPQPPSNEAPSSPPITNETVPLSSRVLPILAFAAYVPSIFSFPGGEPGTPGTATGAFIEAFQLSLNFAFVTPTLFPSQAPILHPFYEAMFNAVIAWALLLIGFASEDLSRRQRVPYGPTAVVAAFLTNLIYLPFLAVRRANSTPVARVPRADASLLLRIAESRFLPVTAIALVFLSGAWALLARPEYGALAQRIADFRTVLSADALAHSLAFDALAFCFFQATLVADDVRRRAWTGPRCDTAVVVARVVPFFGLCFYLWERNKCASLIGEAND